MINYGNIEELNKHLLYKRIIEWDDDKLVLDDGTIVTLEESASCCCAYAEGEFTNVELDAVITNVEIGEEIDIPDNNTIVRQVKITLFHNQNPIALGEMTANAGNGGFYYSIGSLVVNGIHFQIVRT
jgi:hypothetical protein